MGDSDGNDDGYRSLSQTVADTQSQVQQGKESRANTGLRGGLKAAGKSLSASGQEMMGRAQEEAAANANRQMPLNLPSYRKGGKVRKTGVARLHKGEKVIPRGKVKRVERAVRKTKRKKGREL